MQTALPQDSRDHAQGQVLKMHLLSCLKEEQEQLNHLIERFYATAQRDQAACVSYARQLHEVLNRLINAGDWESSLFLRNTIQPIKKVYAQVQTLLENIDADVSEDIARHIEKDQRVVYVSLYQQSGDQLRQWQWQLRSLEQNVLGRPIYTDESHVRQAIRQKVMQVCEAYVAVVISKSSIMAVDAFQAPRVDRNDNTLLNLKAGSVRLDNVLEFVHLNKRYRWHNGQLVLKS